MPQEGTHSLIIRAINIIVTTSASSSIAMFMSTPRAFVIFLGLACLFPLTSAQWNQIGSSFFGEYTYGYNGYAVDINADGNLMVTGEYSFGGNDHNGRMKAYLWDGTQWVATLSVIGESKQYVGSFVAVNPAGNVVAAGSLSDADVPMKVYDLDNLDCTNWVARADNSDNLETPWP